MKYFGGLLLLGGITILIMSYPSGNPALPSWTAVIGGGAIALSYLLSWRG